MIGLSWDEGLLPKRNSMPSPSWVVNQMDKTEHDERKDKKNRDMIFSVVQPMT
jgi:hypothetical protein